MNQKEKTQTSKAKPSLDEVFDDPNIRILVVEDSKLIQQQVNNVFSFYNHRVVKANEGGEAIRILNENPADWFSMVLMDIEMDPIGGFTCIQHIREGNLNDPKKMHIPVVACTGNSKNLSYLQFIKLGFNDVIIKPVNFKKVFDLLYKFLTEPPNQ